MHALRLNAASSVETELSEVPVEISTGIPRIWMNFMLEVLSGLHYVDIYIVSHAYSENDVNSRRCPLGSRLWTGLTVTVEEKL
jgi:hypothetical protein